MSKYTTQVRFICESLSNREENGDFADIDTVIGASRGAIFGNSYSLFDENYRATLETKILKHYYTREIGLETFALWKHFLRTRMNEIMPYYNQLYRSETLEFNPLYDFTYTRDFHREDEEEKQGQKSEANTRTDDTTSATNTSSNNTRTDNTNSATTGTVGDVGWNTLIGKTIDRFSDTPQGGIDGIDPIDRENRYLTNVDIQSVDNNNTNNNTRTYNTNNANTGTIGNAGTGTATTVNTGTVQFETATEDTHTINNLSDYIEHVSGKKGGESYAKMLMDYRKSMINIDMMIIRELGDLFMCIY